VIAGITRGILNNKRNNRVDEIEEYIIDQIFKNRWKQGDRIDDMLIAGELNVSRNSVREALSRLVALNALKKQHWTGYYIPILDRNQAQNTLKLRIMLEKHALELFMQNMTPELIADIQNGIKQSEIDLKNNDAAAFERSDYIIHQIIQNNCGNPWIPNFLGQIWYTIALIRKMDETENFVKYAKRSINEHKKLVKLIKKGNIQETVDCLAEHLEYQRERLDAIFTSPD
jgi:DNA-binding GntR family transcriptional regulator